MPFIFVAVISCKLINAEFCFFAAFLAFAALPFGFYQSGRCRLAWQQRLFQSSVIFITLLAPIFLGEKVGIYRWTAVIAGLAGVVIITDPFSGAMSWYALYGIGAALVGAGLSLMLRQLGKGDAPASVAAWYNMAGFGVLSVIVMILPDQMQSISQSVLIDLVILGVIGSALQIVMTTAYRYSDAVVVASMRYVQMPISGIVGYFVFAEIMSASEIIGALVIIASCLVIAWRELVRTREVNQPGI
jgi:drug/metabolite transporter (DMT)-like permease